MLSQREVQRQYEKLMEDVRTNEFYTKINMENRVNCYVCDCGKITKTKDVDPGVTPFLHKCECGKLARSTMYRDIKPSLQPTEEWYRPSLHECLKYRDRPNVLNHVFNGGLLERKCEVNTKGKTIEEIIYEMSQAGHSKKDIDRAVANVKLSEHRN